MLGIRGLSQKRQPPYADNLPFSSSSTAVQPQALRPVFLFPEIEAPLSCENVIFATNRLPAFADAGQVYIAKCIYTGENGGVIHIIHMVIHRKRACRWGKCGFFHNYAPLCVVESQNYPQSVGLFRSQNSRQSRFFGGFGDYFRHLFVDIDGIQRLCVKCV